MSDPIRFALQLARAVDLLRNAPERGAEGLDAVTALAELCAQRSATIRLARGTLTVEGVEVPGEMPFIPDLIEQMTAHDIGAIHFSHRASPGDLLQLGQLLALGGGQVARDQLVDVHLVSIEAERVAAPRRSLPATSAHPPNRPSLSSVLSVSSVSSVASPKPLLERVLQRLKKGPAREPFEALELAIEGIREAVEAGRVQEGAEALATLVRQEKTLAEGDLRRQYGMAIQRLSGPNILRPLGWLLLDPLYHADVMEIMQRAGAAATEHLLGLLIEAPTFAQRRALLEALRSLREGQDQLVGLLNHEEWYVVRNVADLAGELGVESAVERLGAAVEHPDSRVRKSAGVALARIGAPAAGKYVRKALRDSEREVRLEVARAISGKRFAGLGSAVTAVLETEPDQEVKAELYRALGRIGTPDLVQFLQKTVESGGLLGGRKPTNIRVAATQGLGFAGGDVARATLRELVKDGEKAVRAEAQKALERR